MIQRKQTVYLLLAVALGIATMCLPLGELVPLTGLGAPSKVYPLGVMTDAGWTIRIIWPYLAVMIQTMLALIAIFLYKRRPLQAHLCRTSTYCIVLWTAAIWYCYMQGHSIPSGTAFQGTAVISLPFVEAVMTILARRGVMADERLVRSADRIR